MALPDLQAQGLGHRSPAEKALHRVKRSQIRTRTNSEQVFEVILEPHIFFASSLAKGSPKGFGELVSLPYTHRILSELTFCAAWHFCAAHGRRLELQLVLYSRFHRPGSQAS